MLTDHKTDEKVSWRWVTGNPQSIDASREVTEGILANSIQEELFGGNMTWLLSAIVEEQQRDSLLFQICGLSRKLVTAYGGLFPGFHTGST